LAAETLSPLEQAVAEFDINEWAETPSLLILERSGLFCVHLFMQWHQNLRIYCIALVVTGVAECKQFLEVLARGGSGES